MTEKHFPDRTDGCYPVNEAFNPGELHTPDKNIYDEKYLLTVRDNYMRVLERIEEARVRSGRRDEVKIVAATKTVPAEVVNYAASLGLSCVGENRVQEFLEKEPLLDPSLERHFIGTLQRNKVKYLIGRTALIHSVDSEALASEIGKRALKKGYVQDILLEVNIGREAGKGGIMPELFEEMYDRISEIEGIRTCGIMTIAPKCDKKDGYRKFFAEIYQISLDIKAKKGHNIDGVCLSMGMSDNFDLAVEYGANIVRPGTAIFGRR